MGYLGTGSRYRILAFLLVIAGVNLAGAAMVLRSDTAFYRTSVWQQGNRIHYYYELRDGARIVFVINARAGTATGPFLDRLPRLSRLGEFWWPLVASLGGTGLLTSLTVGDTGGRLRRFLRRPRLSVKGWMIAVAILAASLWAAPLVPRGAGYLDRAADFARVERIVSAELEGDRHALAEWKGEAEEAERGGANGSDLKLHRMYVRTAEGDVSDRLVKIGYYRSLKEKYRRAAVCPWLPVTPDLPVPE